MRLTVLVVEDVVAVVEYSVVEGTLADAVVSEVRVFFKLFRVHEHVLRPVSEHEGSGSHEIGDD